MDIIQDRVNSHSAQLAKQEVLIEGMAKNINTLTEAVSDISKSLNKQALITEKINHIDNKIVDISGTLQSKADADRLKETEEKVKTLEPIIFFTKRPALAIVLVSSAFFLAASELKSVALSLIRFLG